MSWDILPKGNLQYFLQKLKGKLDLKVDAVSGKGLSTNDFTTEEKNKLAGIEAGAQVNPTIDSALSDSSVNAVQNKVVKAALDGKADSEEVPTVNNSTITIQLNGVTVESFKLNQATDETINIQVTKSDVGLGNVGNFYAVSTAENQGLSNLQKKNARDNINATNDEAPDETYNISNHQIQISTSPTPTTVNSFITKLRTLVINVMDDIRTWLNTEFGFDFPVLGTGHKFNAYRQATSTVPDFYESVEEALSEVANGFNDHADWIATKADSNSIPTKVSQLTNDSGFITSYTDTKNTAGTTNTTSKIFLAGATSQAANPQTYSNVNCYASGGKLYSNAKEVVNLSDSQALTNKTYNGYTLAAACAKAVQDDSSATSLTAAALPTGQTITSYLNSNITFFTSELKDFKNLASGSSVTVTITNTSEIKVGFVTLCVCHCGANSITINAPYWHVIGMAFAGSRNETNIPIAKAWDAANIVTYPIFNLTATTRTLTFVNQTGIATSPTYNSRVFAVLVKLR